MSSLTDFATRKLDALDAQHLRRTLVPTRRDGIHLHRDGRRLLTFSCNDYLNLSQDARVKAAAQKAIADHGAGAGASRLVTGDHPLLEALEAQLAAFKGAQAACVFGSGYLANAGIIPTLAGRDDCVVMDELVHSCIRAGARLSGAATALFRHNDVSDARAVLARLRGQHRHCLLATDGVFSMDGDVAPLAALGALARDYDAWLLVDDAHGVGVLNGGRGSTVGIDIPLQMGTLSKALGSYGGYVCADQAVIDLIKTRAGSFIYTTGLPPASAAAASAALAIVVSEPDWVALPLTKARLFTALMGMAEAQSAIVPIVVGTAERALRLSAALAGEGFLVGAIRPPTVPPGTARLRVTFMAAHPNEDIVRLSECLARALRADP